jgi:hypothetical protein
MNIPRRIKLLGAAAALSLASLTGLIAAAPAQARTIAPAGPVSVSSSYYTWYLPYVSLTPWAGSGCKWFTVAGYSAQFVGDTSVEVYLYENSDYGWQQLNINNNSPAYAPVNKSTGALTPTTIWWSGYLPWPEIGTGQYQAWLSDGTRGGATFTITCP